MAKKDVSKIKLPDSEDVLSLKDAEARATLERLLNETLIINCGDATHVMDTGSNNQ